jgi:hypothetical protein
MRRSDGKNDCGEGVLKSCWAETAPQAGVGEQAAV